MLESAGGWSGQILVWCEQMETVLIVCSVLGLAAISGMTLFFFVGPILAGRFQSTSERSFDNRHTHRRKLTK
jgi:hypothetical protein